MRFLILGLATTIGAMITGASEMRDPLDPYEEAFPDLRAAMDKALAAIEKFRNGEVSREEHDAVLKEAKNALEAVRRKAKMNTPNDPAFAFLGKNIWLKLRAGAAYSTARTSSVPEVFHPL